MSVDYYLACHKCKKIIDVASDGASGFSFYSNEPACMEEVRKLLRHCLVDHAKHLGFVLEQSPEWEVYEHLEWESGKL